MAKPMIESALWYRRKGFSVIPCKKDKRPLIKWEPYQLTKPTEDEIKQWWGKWPDANIGLPCGPVSGVDVLDVDTEEAYQNLTEFFLSDSFQTPIAKTPKGRHLYFKHRTGLSNAVRVVPGTDLRTLGGYVIAPPSMNGGGVPYYWLEGLKISTIEFAEWPEELFATLQQGSHPLYSKGGFIRGEVGSPKKDSPQISTQSTNIHNLFNEGTRDDDLFHIANCLVKGGYERNNLIQVLEILANNCNPPFDPSEIPSKVQSAINRKVQRNGKLSDEVRDFVQSTNGHFLSTEVHNSLQISTKDDKKNVSMILARMLSDGIIEKVGKRNGEWRLIDQSCKPMDWINADCAYKELWLPLGLDRICGVQPGNILLVAGAKDSGKTGFLLNIAKENRYGYKIHYFNSEMGAAEFKMRASKFDEPISMWKDVSVYERSDNFPDVIKPGEGNLNIIDFLEVVDEFWKVAATIQKIHQKLAGAMCVIGLQKNPHVDLGRGGAFSLEKARLYLSLDYQKAKIVSCKNFKENDIIEGNPRGYTCKFTLAQGCIIKRQPPGWVSPEQQETK